MSRCDDDLRGHASLTSGHLRLFPPTFPLSRAGLHSEYSASDTVFNFAGCNSLSAIIPTRSSNNKSLPLDSIQDIGNSRIHGHRRGEIRFILEGRQG